MSQQPAYLLSTIASPTISGGVFLMRVPRNDVLRHHLRRYKLLLTSYGLDSNEQKSKNREDFEKISVR
jgi:hypothetical protein